MTALKERYVLDAEGTRVEVLLDVKTFHKIIEQLEELEDIRAYDQAKSSDEEIVPFDQAMREIEQGDA